MKVLHLVSSMDPKMGGVCQAIRMIVKGLTELGVHNEVASLDATDAQFLAHDTFTTHSLGPSVGPWAYAPALRAWLKQNLASFDVVIVHGLWLYHGFAAYQEVRELRKKKALTQPKLFVMPHGMLDPYFQRAVGRKLKAYRNIIYWKLLEKQLINFADGLLFTCEEEQRLAQLPFTPYRPKQELVVGLGVESPPTFTTAMREAFLAYCPSLRNQPYLLFLSRIHEKKGVEMLLQAYAHLSDNSSGPVPALVIAGPGLDTTYGKRMQQLATNSPHAANILFPGMLMGNQKWGAFFGCEAFVLPSHQENFGIAVVEALGCAKPVLISNQVNIWAEIIAANGGLVAADTEEGTTALLAQWQELAQDKQQQMASAAYTAFTTSFAAETTSKKMLAAFAS